MTKITSGCYDGRCYFEAVGHAVAEDTEAFGDNTEGCAVCAAVSILMLTAARRLEEMDAQGDFINACITVESGYALFDINPRESVREQVEELIATLECGCSLLEENYPQLICVG